MSSSMGFGWHFHFRVAARDSAWSLPCKVKPTYCRGFSRGNLAAPDPGGELLRNKTCIHIRQYGCCVNSPKSTADVWINGLGELSVEPLWVDLCPRCLEITPFISASHSFMRTCTVRTSSTASSSQCNLPEHGESQVHNGGWFDGHAAESALVKGGDTDALQGAESPDLPAAPDTCGVFLRRPQWELRMFRKSGSTWLSQAKHGLKQKADKPGSNKALLPLSLVQVGETQRPCTWP